MAGVPSVPGPALKGAKPGRRLNLVPRSTARLAKRFSWPAVWAAGSYAPFAAWHKS